MIQCKPENLFRLLSDLEPKRKIQALKGASQRIANKVRKKAVENLKVSGLKSNQDLEKGIKKIIFKKQVGFRVSIATKTKKKKYKGKRNGVRRYGRARRVLTDFSLHTTSQGKELPILIWAEGGTKKRKTKTRTKIFVRKRKGHSTGSMKPYRFMRKTERDMNDRITAEFRKAMEESIIRTVKRYGHK